jgi:hypothetical protein
MNYYRYPWRNLLRKAEKGIMMVILLSSIPLSYSQNVPVKATRQSAVNEFNSGKFDTAYDQFTQLTSLYPKDPLYKYYRGVCLVKLERDPHLASDLLDTSVRESAAIRQVPSDAQFYLGRARQQAGLFDEAIRSYESFTSLSGKKAAREMNVPELIKQCESGKGSIVIRSDTGGEIHQGESASISGKVSAIAVPLAETPKSGVSAGSMNVVNDQYDKLAGEAIVLQSKSDSLTGIAEKYRHDLKTAPAAEASALQTRIRELDKQAADYHTDADLKMAEAGRLAGLPDTANNLQVPPVDTVSVVQETAFPINEGIMNDKPVSQPDTVKTIAVKTNVDEGMSVVKTEIFSDFKVEAKPVFKPDEKVPVNPEVPGGLIYRIQMAVFRNPVAPAYFKGISPIHGFRNDATGVVTYYAGMFRKSSDAGKALTKVKSLGFRDAFVVALMDRKAVSTDRAALLEKEWGAKPLYTESKNAQVQEKDTVPPTLVFRVEVRRSPKPLPKDQVENMKVMAGNRGFDIIVNEKKTSIYLIGTFLTYRSATEYSDLLVRNGYREAKVVAYLGQREIPVDTARQLFDEY